MLYFVRVVLEEVMTLVRRSLPNMKYNGESQAWKGISPVPFKRKEMTDCQVLVEFLAQEVFFFLLFLFFLNALEYRTPSLSLSPRIMQARKFDMLRRASIVLPCHVHDTVTKIFGHAGLQRLTACRVSRHNRILWRCY